MRVLNLLLVLLAVVIGTFLLLNWSAVVANQTLSFGVTTLQAPLGLIQLVILALVVAFFAVYVLVLQSGSMMDARRMNKELMAQRELADKAEASRFSELRAYLDTTLQQRLDALEADVRREVTESGNALAAQLAGLEDRLARAGQLAGPVHD